MQATHKVRVDRINETWIDCIINKETPSMQRAGLVEVLVLDNSRIENYPNGYLYTCRSYNIKSIAA